MKKVKTLLFALCCSMAATFLFAFNQNHNVPSLNGSWHWEQGTEEATIIFADGYCVFAFFDQKNKKFEYTWGGPYKVNESSIVVELQFNTKVKELTGTVFSFAYNWKNDKLLASFRGTGTAEEWTQGDNGKADLAGTWRISGRKQGENISEIPLAPRRTLKVLSATKFQWVAINIETKEFFGTGGGRYTFENGQYTEHIEFFSRDSSRVGASLSFQGKLEERAWHHSGLSSKGDPIYEIWKRINQ